MIIPIDPALIIILIWNQVPTTTLSTTTHQRKRSLDTLILAGVIESERYRPAIDRIAASASRLAQVIDVPSAEELAAVFGDAGWVTERPGRFTADQLAAAVFTGWGTTSCAALSEPTPRDGMLPLAPDT